MWIVIWNFPLFVPVSIFKTILSWEWAEVSKEKSAKFQTTFHIDYDREAYNIRFSMVSQTKMIRTLVETLKKVALGNLKKVSFILARNSWLIG